MGDSPLELRSEGGQGETGKGLFLSEEVRKDLWQEEVGDQRASPGDQHPQMAPQAGRAATSFPERLGRRRRTQVQSGGDALQRRS